MSADQNQETIASLRAAEDQHIKRMSAAINVALAVATPRQRVKVLAGIVYCRQCGEEHSGACPEEETKR